MKPLPPTNNTRSPGVYKFLSYWLACIQKGVTFQNLENYILYFTSHNGFLDHLSDKRSVLWSQMSPIGNEIVCAASHSATGKRPLYSRIFPDKGKKRHRAWIMNATTNPIPFKTLKIISINTTVLRQRYVQAIM